MGCAAAGFPAACAVTWTCSGRKCFRMMGVFFSCDFVHQTKDVVYLPLW